MASTTFGDQVINTIDNLNMKGKFKEDSLRQFENLNTAVIKYTDNLGLADEGSKLQLYDSISESIIDFELVGQQPIIEQNDFERNTLADVTAQNLTDRINDITLQGTATNNHYSAIIEYFDTLNDATPNDTITLYNYQTAVVFTMVTTISTPPQPTAVEFEEGGDADATATNLCNAINNHSSFSAIIDITKNIIIITQISSSGKPTNNAQNGFVPTSELSVTNFSNLSATIDKPNNTITVIQNSSKSYKDNSINNNGFKNSNSSDNTIALNVQNFRVNSGDEAAIPSETIGTYQIIDKIITDLSLLKKKITSRNKILQNDLSNDHTDSNGVGLTEPDTSNKVATYISNISADKNRGNLNLNAVSSKPSIFESDTIKYSEDALFTLLKGLFYEILKFKNGITDGVNNGGTSGGAGKQSIPIAISASNNTGAAASLTNVIATIENINKSDGTFDLFANTSNTSIPSENTGTIKFVGLLQLINEFIKNLVEIKNQIKINETELLTALNANNSDPVITVSNVDSKITILKVRNGFTEDNNSTDNFHKPSIFTSDKKYSEDAVFGLFSCISYELMKLLNGTDASNNNSIIGFAGLQAIPVSIEDV